MKNRKNVFLTKGRLALLTAVIALSTLMGACASASGSNTDSSVTSTTAPTAEPTVEPTAEPTAEPTVAPTVEPTVEPTAEPTATVAPTATPEPTATTAPTATPEPTATVAPTATPEPTATTAPTATVAPTATPKPTAAPTSSAVATPTPATEETIELVMAHPGEDATTQVNLSWHSTAESCMVEYTLASDKKFRKAKEIVLDGVKNDTEKYYDVESGSFYNYKCTLEDLSTGKDYIYRITAYGSVSETYSFKTAGKDGSFNFGWVADVHANPGESTKIKNVNKLVANLEALTSENKGLDFFLFTGDMVEYGNNYSHWLQWDKSDLFRNYTVATIPGNKEYYKQTDSGRIKYYSGEWYLDNTNTPANGPDGAEACYWFIYENVLFLSINANQEPSTNNKVPNDGDAILAAQQKWFREVVEAQKGNYQYIVVQTHYAYFDTSSTGGDGPCSWGGYNNWRKLFDEYSVDLAISGDYHEYVRTNSLYNNAVSTDAGKGTVYLTFAQIPTYTDGITVRDSSNPLVAKCSNSSSIAAGVFSVTKEGITFQLMGYSGKVVDTVTVAAKNR